MSSDYSLQSSPQEILERIEGFPSWFEVDLDALSHNLREIRERVGVEVMAVVKNNENRIILPLERAKAARILDNLLLLFMLKGAYT
jgi:hypothetical protein